LSFLNNRKFSRKVPSPLELDELRAWAASWSDKLLQLESGVIVGGGYCNGGAAPSTGITETEIAFGGTPRLNEQIKNTLFLHGLQSDRTLNLR
jgi:hypothetical protein